MVITHLLNGMILQVPSGGKIEGGWQRTISTIVITLLGTAPYPLPVGTFESMIFRISQGGICYRFLEVILQNKALVGNSVGVFHICPCDWLDVWWNSFFIWIILNPPPTTCSSCSSVWKMIIRAAHLHWPRQNFIGKCSLWYVRPILVGGFNPVEKK